MSKTIRHSFRVDKLPKIKQTENSAQIKGLIQAGRILPSTQTYTMGKVRILVGNHDQLGYHMTVLHPDRFPTLDEVFKARWELIPAAARMVLHVPSQSVLEGAANTSYQLQELKPVSHDGPQK